MSKKAIDMTGYQIYDWIVLSMAPAHNQNNKNKYWLCKCKICGYEKELNGTDLRKGTVAKNCNHKTLLLKKQQETKEKRVHFKKDEPGTKYGYLTILEYLPNSMVLCKCDCGNIKQVRIDNLHSKRVFSCGCNHKSHGEQLINSFLMKKNIYFLPEYSFDDLKGDKGGKLRFDFAIFKDKEFKNLAFLIEFQGRQHYETDLNSKWNSPIPYDKYKREYCRKNNISLLEIPYFKINNIEDILNEYLSSLL